MAELWGEPGGCSVPSNPAWLGSWRAREVARLCSASLPTNPLGCWQSPSRDRHPDQIKELRFTRRIKPQHPPGPAPAATLERARRQGPALQLDAAGEGGPGLLEGSLLFPAEGTCHSPHHSRAGERGAGACASPAGLRPLPIHLRVQPVPAPGQGGPVQGKVHSIIKNKTKQKN